MAVRSSCAPRDFTDPQKSKLPPGLKPGDTVKIPRKGGIYYHYGVYIGDQGDGGGNFVHVAGNKEGGGPMMLAKGRVERADLETVANGSPISIANDLKEDPKKTSDIIADCLDALGKDGAEYNLTQHNCEHFANFMRYGKKYSSQGHMLEGTMAGGMQIPVMPWVIEKRMKESDRRVEEMKFPGEKK